MNTNNNNKQEPKTNKAKKTPVENKTSEKSKENHAEKKIPEKIPAPKTIPKKPIEEGGCYEDGDNEREPSGDNGSEPSDDNGREPSDDNGREPSGDNEREPSGDNGREPSDDNGREPSDDNGREPSDDNGREPSGDNEGEPSGDNGREPGGDNEGEPSGDNEREPSGDNEGEHSGDSESEHSGDSESEHSGDSESESSDGDEEMSENEDMEKRRQKLINAYERERDEALAENKKYRKSNKLLRKKLIEAEQKLESSNIIRAENRRRFEKAKKIITFNVGGRIYTTSKKNIPRDSFLHDVITKKNAKKINNIPFIDRCSFNFNIILNGLRGYPVSNEMYSDSVLEDIKYYRLPVLEGKIRKNKRSRIEYEESSTAILSAPERRKRRKVKKKRKKSALDVYKKLQYDLIKKREDYNKSSVVKYFKEISEMWNALSKEEKKKYEPNQC